MTTKAVTPEAPAVSESNSSFLPTDEHYRLTGEKSAEAVHDPRAQREERRTREAAERNEKRAVKEEESATSTEKSEKSAETAAAPAAATTTEDKEEKEEKGPARTKTPETSESRWAKMSRENRELREQLAKASTAQPSKETTRETPAAPQTVTEAAKGNAEPKIDDVDPKTGKAKYATLGEYLADHSKWNREEGIRQYREESTKTQQEQHAAETERVIHNENVRRTDQARKDYPDYDELAAAAFDAKDEQGRPLLFYTKNSPIEGFFLDSERSHDVFHEIFQDLEKHGAIFARDAQGKYLMNPVRQLRELAKIEHSLPEKGAPDKGKSSSASVRSITQAPRPPHQVSGKGNVAKDAIERAVEEGDSESYIREQNNRALARLAKKG